MEGWEMSEDRRTPEDIKNGWSAEDHAAYHAERQQAKSGYLLFDPKFRPKPKPRVANGKYSPLRAFR
jgi:hypothetical protein